MACCQAEQKIIHKQVSLWILSW